MIDSILIEEINAARRRFELAPGDVPWPKPFKYWGQQFRIKSSDDPVEYQTRAGDWLPIEFENGRAG